MAWNINKLLRYPNTKVVDAAKSVSRAQRLLYDIGAPLCPSRRYGRERAIGGHGMVVGETYQTQPLEALAAVRNYDCYRRGDMQ